MIAKVEPKTYLWRQAPSHPKLLITKLEVGPALNEGEPWVATFCIRERLGIPTMAFTATYGGHGGPVDLAPIYHDTKAGRDHAKKKFDKAMKYLKELWFCSRSCTEFSPDAMAEILVTELTVDYEKEQKFRRTIARRGLVGFTAKGEAFIWKPHKGLTVVELCEIVRNRSDGADIVEWFHETIGYPDGEPKPHVCKPIPEEERWKAPPDLPCAVCGDSIDRKRYGTYTKNCNKLLCEVVYDEARSMVDHKTRGEPLKADTLLMQPRLGGHGSHGAIGSMVRLSFHLDCREWPSEKIKAQARDAFDAQLDAYRALAAASKVGWVEEAHSGWLWVPTYDEFETAYRAYDALVERMSAGELKE